MNRGDHVRVVVPVVAGDPSILEETSILGMIDGREGRIVQVENDGSCVVELGGEPPIGVVIIPHTYLEVITEETSADN